MSIKDKFIKCSLCVMFLTFFGQVSVAQDNVIDRVEWVVGDKAILRSDIEEAIRLSGDAIEYFEG